MVSALRHLVITFPVLACLTAVAAPLRAQEEPLPPNPFARFESVRLPNGMKLWYGYLPAATVTSMAVVVPYGRDHDPPGGEQTAHLLEHVLLSDRAGRAGADLARELAARGGQHNGFTEASSLAFTLSIATDQAAYGVEWLHDVIAPRTLSDALVDRNREPVAVEIGARKRTPATPLAARILRHPRMVPPRFWRREFGLDAQEERRADHSAALAQLSAADLQRWFDTYFAPSEMTLVVVSGVPREVLQPVIDATFAQIMWRPPPASPAAAAPRVGPSHRYAWQARASTRVSLGFRVAELDGRDQLRLIFMEDLLRYRLMERLRRGGDKSVYTVNVHSIMRGAAAYFGIVAEMRPGQEPAARDIIDEEVRRLIRAPFDTTAFYADRAVLSRRIRIENASTVMLRNWVTDRFARPDLHEHFPDLGEYYATVGPDSIGAYAARLFVPSNRVLISTRPLPLPFWLLALLGMVPILAAARAYRALTLRPADMSQVRFIARIRPHPLAAAAGAMLTAVALLAAVRLFVAAAHLGADRWLVASPSFGLRAALLAALLFAATLAAFALCGLVPRKVVVLAEEIRLKSRTFRAVHLHRAALRSATVVGSRGGRRLRWPVLPPTRRAVFLELHDGSGYLLQVRHPEALARRVQEMLQVEEPQSVSMPLAMVPVGGEPCADTYLSS
jgi:predicted Zn-dependent peptidase